MIRKMPALAALAALLISANASAASLALVTTTPQLSPGQTVLTVTVQGFGFVSTTSGGDFSIAFDGAALQFVSGAVNAPFDTIAFHNSSLQPATLGTPSPIRVDVLRLADGYVGAGGVLFDVATLNFNILGGFGAGTTVQLGPDTFLGLGWSNPSFDPITVDYATAGSLQISPVPAPPALWLLGTAVGGLVVRRLRRKGA